MKFSINDFNGRLATGMHIRRYTTAFIFNTDDIILFDGYPDNLTIAVNGFIHGIIEYFPH